MCLKHILIFSQTRHAIHTPFPDVGLTVPKQQPADWTNK